MEQKQRNRILLVLFVGVLMGALDIAIVGPALPAIQGQLSVIDRNLSWIFSVYVLFNLIGTPLMAKLSDINGRRLVYIVDVSLFAIGSLVVSLSSSFVMLLVGRAIQGLGAGGIFPVAGAVIGDVFPPEKRGSALGLIGAVFGLAFIIGPILGGIFLSFTSWHWLFIINIPIAVVVIIMSLRFLPVVKPTETKKFDVLGMLILAFLLASLSFGINQIDTNNFFSSVVSVRVLPFLVVFVILLFSFIQAEKKAENPIVPGNLFSKRQLALAYILSAGAGVGEASLVFMPVLAIASLGMKQAAASFMLMPVVLAMTVGSPTVGKLLDKVGSKTVIVTGTSVMTIGMLLLSQFSENQVLFIVSGALIGFGLSALLGAPIRYIMLNESDVSERSVAQGVVVLFTSAGQLISAALVGAVAASSVDEVVGYSKAFSVVAIVGAVLVMVATLLKSRREELT